MTPAEKMRKRNLVAQWAFDTRPILGRFHLWLDDVEVQLERNDRWERVDGAWWIVPGRG